MSASKSTLIPDFLKARSPQGLRRLMLLKNQKDGLQYNYFSIQFVNGEWYVWFYRDLDANNFSGMKEVLEAKE